MRYPDLLTEAARSLAAGKQIRINDDESRAFGRSAKHRPAFDDAPEAH